MSAQLDIQVAGQGIGLTGAGLATGTSIAASGLSLATGLATAGIGAGLAILIMSIFHGANPNQVPASQIEQIFEIAADNLYSLLQAGYITQAQAIAGMQALIQAGQQMEAQYQPQIGNPAVKGSENLTKVINAEIADAQSLSPIPPLQYGITLAQAQAAYDIKPGAKGWYPGSITKASNITDQLFQQFMAQNVQPSNPISDVISALTGTGTAKSGTITTVAPIGSLTHLILLGLLAFAIWKVAKAA